MNKGDVIICRASNGYAFTEGKEYVILDYTPKFYDITSSSGFA